MESKLAVALVAGALAAHLEGCCHCKPPEKPQSQPVSEITALSLRVTGQRPSGLLIIAEGIVPSAGWSAPALIPVVYVQAPNDGIYEFTFVALPPGDSAAQVLTHVTATTKLDPRPPNLKGIRVKARTNDKVEFIGNGDGSGQHATTPRVMSVRIH